MPAINHREFKRRYELEGADATVEHLREALSEKHLRPEDFSVRELAESLVPDGREWVDSMNPRNGGVSAIRESAVNTSAFSNVMGQIVYNKLLEAYTMEDFVCSRLIDTISTRFSGEKIAGTAQIGDQAATVAEGMPFPEVGFGEDYIDTPDTVKKGMIVPVTKEAVFFDRTSQILRRAADVGTFLGLNKEKRVCNAIVGGTTLGTTWVWRGTSYTNIWSTGLFTNSQANALADWTDVDASEQLFVDILDPHTGEPVLISGKDILVMPHKKFNAMRIFGASEVRVGDGASVTTQTVSGNPLAGEGYRVHSSRILYRRVVADGISTSNAKEYWYHGDFKKAFAYMENWPLTVTQAPANSEAEFTSDIVFRFKASERGVVAVLDPRYVVRNTN